MRIKVNNKAVGIYLKGPFLDVLPTCFLRLSSIAGYYSTSVKGMPEDMRNFKPEVRLSSANRLMALPCLSTKSDVVAVAGVPSGSPPRWHWIVVSCGQLEEW